MKGVETYSKNSPKLVFGIILWILGILFLILLITYQIETVNGCGSGCNFTTLNSYQNTALTVITELTIFVFVLIGAYLIFTTIQLVRDANKLADSGNNDKVKIIDPQNKLKGNKAIVQNDDMKEIKTTKNKKLQQTCYSKCSKIAENDSESEDDSIYV